MFNDHNNIILFYNMTLSYDVIIYMELSIKKWKSLTVTFIIRCCFTYAVISHISLLSIFQIECVHDFQKLPVRSFCG